MIFRSKIKVRDSKIPIEAIYNQGFEKLKRFDNSKNRLMIKPVMLQWDHDYSRIRKDVEVVSMEVTETGEIIDYINAKGKMSLNELQDKIKKRNIEIEMKHMKQKFNKSKI